MHYQVVLCFGGGIFFFFFFYSILYNPEHLKYLGESASGSLYTPTYRAPPRWILLHILYFLCGHCINMTELPEQLLLAFY
jgi:quinol-cytochrome oxidoreductase complex cytochrome b subunit